MNDINSASIGIVKSNQQSILNYHSVFRPRVNSQQSTVNYNSGATGIDMTNNQCPCPIFYSIKFKCFLAATVTILPRFVRCKNPICIK